MAQVRDGNEAALGVLMERWQIPVKSLVAKIVLNSTDAEELALEAFVRVWQQRENFRAGAKFRPWLFAIAVNLSRNRLRWWRRRPEVKLEEWIETASEHANGADQTERLERAVAVRNALAALSTRMREVIVLFAFENLSHVEIAAVVGATPKAVERRIAYARQKLRPFLQRSL